MPGVVGIGSPDPKVSRAMVVAELWVTWSYGRRFDNCRVLVFILFSFCNFSIIINHRLSLIRFLKVVHLYAKMRKVKKIPGCAAWGETGLISSDLVLKQTTTYFIRISFNLVQILVVADIADPQREVHHLLSHDVRGHNVLFVVQVCMSGSSH